jgi:hypothetical protein
MGLLELDLTKPDFAAAESLLMKSADLARASGALPILAQTELTLAELWTRTAKLQQSAEALDSAEWISRRINYRGLADDIARLRSRLAELGFSTHPTRL